MQLRVSLLAVLVLVGVQLHAQQARRLFVGAFGDGHIVHAAWTDDYVGWSSNPATRETVRPSGAGGGAVALYELSRKWMIIESFSFLKDVINTKYDIYDQQGQGTYTTELAQAYSWIDLSSSIFYKPLVKPSYAILTGAGISVRYLTSATLEDDSYSLDITDQAYRWSYFVPLQAGVELPAHPRGRFVLLAGFQFGLRHLFRGVIDTSPTVFDYSWSENNLKLHSTTLKIAYMIGFPKRTAVK